MGPRELAAVTAASTGVSWHVTLPDVSPPGVDFRSPRVLHVPDFVQLSCGMKEDDLVLDGGASVRPGWSRLWVAEDWCLRWSSSNTLPGFWW